MRLRVSIANTWPYSTDSPPKPCRGRELIFQETIARDPQSKTTHRGENVLLDELATGFDLIAHQDSESLIG